MTRRSKTQRPKDVLAWAAKQRLAYHKGLLTEAQIAKCESMPGWTWDLIGDIWPTHYGELKSFVSANGYLPNNSKWVLHQRTFYKNGKLSDERISLLEAIPGWTWNALGARYAAKYARLKSFIEDNGRMPTAQESPWAFQQRGLYKAGNLSAERISLLEAIPLWTWESHADAWGTKYEELKSFIAKTGRLWTLAEDKSGWINSQRVNYKANTILATRVALLESLPFWTWDGRSDWLLKYEELKQIIAETGCLPTCKKFYWIDNQRRAYKADRMPADRVNLLNALPGWKWSDNTGRRVDAGGHKLTWELVRKIRATGGGVGESKQTLAAEYGLHLSTIYKILNNQIWVEES